MTHRAKALIRSIAQIGGLAVMAVVAAKHVDEAISVYSCRAMRRLSILLPSLQLGKMQGLSSPGKRNQRVRSTRSDGDIETRNDSFSIIEAIRGRIGM